MIPDWLKRLLGWPVAPVRPPCRLSEAQARAIASSALGGETALIVHDVIATEDDVEWRIGTATMGTGEVAHISDATGTVLRIEQWGVR
jgi:hypothetical protein